MEPDDHSVPISGRQEKPEAIWKTILRWICFFPASLAAAILAWNVVLSGNNLFNVFFGGSTDFISRILIRSLSNLAMVATFAILGAYIAPSGKKIVAYAHCTISILYAGILSAYALSNNNWSALVDILSIAGSAMLVAYNISEGAIDIEQNTKG